MKILVLTSRYTAHRDIIGEDFGRQTRLFEEVKKLNHEIDFYCADYQKFESKKLKLHGINVTIEPFSLFYAYSFVSKLKKKIKKNRYGLIFITSDPLWSFFGYYLQKKGFTVVYDIQDNYVTYTTWKIPFVKKYHEKLIKRASLVVCASNILKQDILNIRKKKIITITNGADLGLFKPSDKKKSREILKLPKKAKIISFIGTIQKLAGTDILVDAFVELRKEIPSSYLLLIGRISTEGKQDYDLHGKNKIFKGSIPQKDVVVAINASDVLVMPYPNNKFTRVMFAPYKIVEYMACNRPIVITDVGEMSNLLKDSRFVAKAGDKEDLKNKIKAALKVKKVNYRPRVMEFSWKSLAKKLDIELKKLKQ